MKYFTDKETKCKHCGEIKVNEFFGAKMDELRKAYGQPIHINSWYRCPMHDSAIGGKGEHTHGTACDIKISGSRERFVLLSLALKLGFNRIGVAKGFLHLSVGTPGYSPAVLWTY
jgi:zinc D-Ala-D-Ala carboxypeptidase